MSVFPDLAIGNPPIPATNSQADKWSKAVREKLGTWVPNEALPILKKHAEATGVGANFSVEEATIHVDYDSLEPGGGYVAPRVKLEFGARSTGEPAETRSIACDAAQHLPALTFPAAMPRIMLPKRTFWEKATAIHVYCARGFEGQGDRISRHWHDLVRLDDGGFAQTAFEDTALAKEVADWKAKFFRARDRSRKPIDYVAAVSGQLQLVPDQGGRKELEADYKKMAEAGILLDDAEPFSELMNRCALLQDRANARN
jgi:Nucleotidyl transferase AbiEii toxin, Type IV TA system